MLTMGLIDMHAPTTKCVENVLRRDLQFSYIFCAWQARPMEKSYGYNGMVFVCVFSSHVTLKVFTISTVWFKRVWFKWFYGSVQFDLSFKMFKWFGLKPF